MHFGIREHAMGAVTNGITPHGGLRPFSATFGVQRLHETDSPARSAQPLTQHFCICHDSIFLGEDGPTHQPIEHHWALRSMPGLAYFRPADGVEVAMSWAWALNTQDRPTAFGLTRQGIRIARDADSTQRVFGKADTLFGMIQADVTLIGTGSELHVCTNAADELRAGIRCRVVSMPSVDLRRARS